MFLNVCVQIMKTSYTLYEIEIYYLKYQCYNKHIILYGVVYLFLPKLSGLLLN